MARPPKYDLSVTFEGAPDTKKLDKFSEEDIERLLSVLPKTKYMQGGEALKRLETYEDAKRETKHETAKQRLIASAAKDVKGLGSDKDREAWASQQPTVIKRQKAELNANIQLKLAELKYQYLEDLFVAVRKMATKYEKLNDAAEHRARYERS